MSKNCETFGCMGKYDIRSQCGNCSLDCKYCGYCEECVREMKFLESCKDDGMEICGECQDPVSSDYFDYNECMCYDCVKRYGNDYDEYDDDNESDYDGNDYDEDYDDDDEDGYDDNDDNSRNKCNNSEKMVIIDRACSDYRCKREYNGPKCYVNGNCEDCRFCNLCENCSNDAMNLEVSGCEICDACCESIPLYDYDEKSGCCWDCISLKDRKN